jgi:integral membrane protein (TIGR00529 family)
MAVIMLLIRKGINIGLAMLAGAGVLAITAPVAPTVVWGAALAALTDPTTWSLTLVIIFIGVLGYVLKESGALGVMVDSLLRLLGDARWLMAALPGLMGLLTVPGGAMMSAPMVDQLGDKVGIGPEHKTGINLIYRHLMYLVFPMMTSIILATSLAGITPLQLVGYNVPVLVVGAAASWYFLLRGVSSGEAHGSWSLADLGWFAVSTLPILSALLLFILLDLNFPTALAIGIVISMLILPGGDGRLSRRMFTCGCNRAKTMLRPGFKPEMIWVVLGIMVYKEMLHASSLVTTFTFGLMEMGIPLWLLLMVLPFAVGMVTGVHTATIGIVVPIFLPLLPQESFMAGLSLMYVSSTIGYVISPLHLCLILTKEFYQAKFNKTYRYITPVAGMMMAAALAIAIIRGL